MYYTILQDRLNTFKTMSLMPLDRVAIDLQSHVYPTIFSYFPRYPLNTTFPYNAEITVTFNPSFYNIGNAASNCSVVVTKLLRQLCTVTVMADFTLEVSMEYHANGYPHLHIGVYSREFLQNLKQNLWQIISKMLSGYGRNTIYHNPTPGTHRVHELDATKQAKYGVASMDWSQYIRKDIHEHSHHYKHIDIKLH